MGQHQCIKLLGLEFLMDRAGRLCRMLRWRRRRPQPHLIIASNRAGILDSISSAFFQDAYSKHTALPAGSEALAKV